MNDKNQLGRYFSSAYLTAVLVIMLDGKKLKGADLSRQKLLGFFGDRIEISSSSVNALLDPDKPEPHRLSRVEVMGRVYELAKRYFNRSHEARERNKFLYDLIRKKLFCAGQLAKILDTKPKREHPEFSPKDVRISTYY